MSAEGVADRVNYRLIGPGGRRTLVVEIASGGVVHLPDGADPLDDGVWEVFPTEEGAKLAGRLVVENGVLGRAESVREEVDDLDLSGVPLLGLLVSLVPRRGVAGTFAKILNSVGEQVGQCSCGIFHAYEGMSPESARQVLHDNNALGLLDWLAGVSAEVLESQGFRDQAEVLQFREAVERVLQGVALPTDQPAAAAEA